MTTLTILGVDISKIKYDVALLNNGKLKKFTNNLQGFEDLWQWLNKHDALMSHACMETTGIYSEALAEHFFDAGITMSVVNRARIKGFAQSELLCRKTDKIDAGLIPGFCYAMQPQA